MIVLQLISCEKIPHVCEVAMAAWERWALARGFKYRAETFDLPEGWSPYSRSNYLRSAAASVRAPLLYADWDIVPNSNFDIDDVSKPWCDKADPDALFYSPNIEVWKGIYEEMGAYYKSVPTAILEISRLWKILYRRIADGQYCPNYFSGGYTHLHQRSS